MPAIPIHEQIAADIRERIANGSLKPREQLPTKRELAEQWDCSIQPVTTALMRLEYEGLVIRRQGKGTFVADRPDSKPTSPRSKSRRQ
jgi:GntR family transcriptional regulator